MPSTRLLSHHAPTGEDLLHPLQAIAIGQVAGCPYAAGDEELCPAVAQL